VQTSGVELNYRSAVGLCMNTCRKYSLFRVEGYTHCSVCDITYNFLSSLMLRSLIIVWHSRNITSWWVRWN